MIEAIRKPHVRQRSPTGFDCRDLMDRGQFGAQGGYLGPERDKLGRRRKLFDNEGRCGGGLRGPSHLAYGGRGRTPSRLRHGIEAREAERANVGRARFEHHEMDEVTGDGHAELLDDGPIEITPQWRRGNPQSQAGYFFNSLLACKLAVIMHAMLRTGELFDPHGGTPAAA